MKLRILLVSIWILCGCDGGYYDKEPENMEYKQQLKTKELEAKQGLTDRAEILRALQNKRTNCTVWTRVMGYHRPVETFNIGKTQEHKEREYFKESKMTT